MVLTYEQRIALLAKAREAKKAKKAAADSLKPVPVKGRPKKVTAKKEEKIDENTENTLDLVDKDKLEFNDNEIKEMIKPSKQEVDEVKKIENIGNPKHVTKKSPSKIEPDEEEVEPEIVEEVVVKKVKKPKKRIVRKIIKEQYDSESTEEEYEEVIYEAPKYKPAKPKPKPIEPEVRSSRSGGFNLFSY